MAGILSRTASFPSWRHEWFSTICYGGKLRDPTGVVGLTGPSPGQPAVHPLSRLDRPAVTHSAVKPWAGVFEMWQHNQFPWFMITPPKKEGVLSDWAAERRTQRGKCWRQPSDTQRSTDSSSGSGYCSSPSFPGYITIMWDFIDPREGVLFPLNDVQRTVRAVGQSQCEEDRRSSPSSTSRFIMITLGTVCTVFALVFDELVILSRPNKRSIYISK